MVSRVLYKPFEESDFEALIPMIQTTWYHDGKNDACSALQARADLAKYLSISSFSQVALLDGVPSGIVLARSNDQSPALSDHWKDVFTNSLREMETIDQEIADAHNQFLTAEDRVNTDLLQQAGLTRTNEITLLCVAPSAQGLGIGGVLLDAAAAYIASQGASRAFLFTDTSCTWEFYERRGLKRRATHRSTREERKLLPREMYIYGLDLSA